jgi:sialate O-acetylesterase
MKKIFSILLFMTALVGYSNADAQVRLPKLISDNMVLQRDTRLKIWGWAGANERVNIKFNGKTYKTKADGQGNWAVFVPPMKAGGPYTLNIVASNSITINNILFGDVWFCSGQSNMVHQMNIHDVTYAMDIKSANYPEIRQFLVPVANNLEGPKDDFSKGTWQVAVGEEVRPFSAVAFFFARKLYDKYKIPIGLINASVGGTPIAAWTSEEGLKEFPAFRSIIQKNKDTGYVNALNRNVANSIVSRPLQDKGIIESPKWFEEGYHPPAGAWRSINIPGYWEDQGIKDLNGVVWYRKEIDLPASMAGKSAKVFLGRIVDADVLYINGKQVGNTTYMYPQRRYTIPSGVLKAGKNIFAIKVTNNFGKGGFVPDKPYCIFLGNDTIDLKGTWQYRVGEVFTPRSGSGVTGINGQDQPAGLYNAMVAPAISYAIKGILWYQGETDTGKAEEYARWQPALISDWRSKWNQPGTPFLFVQLPGFMEYNYLPVESQWATFRESQLRSLSVAHTAMAVAIDLGEWNDIHPDNKKDVGERLAIAAQKLVYGENIVHSGPVFHSYKTEGSKIILTFENVGSGLLTKDGNAPAEFSIAGADKKFVWAKTKIDGDNIVVWNDAISQPLHVRYAWADNPVNPNLYNREGLPATPFRTDR